MKHDFVIVPYPHTNNTPAAVLATRGWLEVLEDQGADPILNVYWDHKALVAFGRCITPSDPDSSGPSEEWYPVAVLTWQHLEAFDQVFINIGWVSPPWRRRGAFTALFEHLVDVEVPKLEKPVRQIQFGTSVRNKRMRGVGAKLGFVEDAITLTMRLPDLSAPRPAFDPTVGGA